MKATKKIRAEFFDLHGYVLDQLESRKGSWLEISERADVPYFTISKIATRATADPRISTIQKLANYFTQNPKAA
ncbi:hypothetical protein ACFSKY_22850 [Azotobacter chroococcum]|uniref:XRE family transcriptional regulator n=1 Tax=Azotobacter chroococcum TaxID=353 RepID=A0A4R1P6C4_9GAMM|nr:Cro/Cl family transcriptional regulator [Azotobacter chroococcum]TBV95280.1 Cro/Cl family transcriptional regulator [Azotobacter chroococcum]TCL22093.1 hypothetical protein EV691_13542 [Azotobacter chroococcum]